MSAAVYQVVLTRPGIHDCALGIASVLVAIQVRCLVCNAERTDLVGVAAEAVQTPLAALMARLQSMGFGVTQDQVCFCAIVSVSVSVFVCLYLCMCECVFVCISVCARCCANCIRLFAGALASVSVMVWGRVCLC